MRERTTHKAKNTSHKNYTSDIIAMRATHKVISALYDDFLNASTAIYSVKEQLSISIARLETKANAKRV